MNVIAKGAAVLILLSTGTFSLLLLGMSIALPDLDAPLKFRLTMVFVAVSVLFMGGIIYIFGQAILDPATKMSALLGVRQFSREESDWRRFQDALPELEGISRNLSEVIAARVLDSSNPPHVARMLLKTVLIRTQQALEKFCPGCLCSLKLLKSTAGELFFECLYIDKFEVAEHGHFVEQFKRVKYHGTYAGHALDKDELIIVSDIWNETNISRSISTQNSTAMKEAGLHGLAVVPVKLMNPKGKYESKLIFKVDCFAKGGLVDNVPTRRLLTLIAGYFALVLNFAFVSDVGLRIDDERASEHEAN